jgi:hypothetical protein
VLQSKPSKFAVLATQAMSLTHGDAPGLSKSCNDPDLSLGRTATWRMSVQMALAGTAAAVALMAGLAVCRADPLDSSLMGAWAASAADCSRLFQPRGGAHGLSAAGRQVRPSLDYRASADCHTFMPAFPTQRSRPPQMPTTVLFSTAMMI